MKVKRVGIFEPVTWGIFQKPEFDTTVGTAMGSSSPHSPARLVQAKLANTS